MSFFSTLKSRTALLVGGLLALTVAVDGVGWFATRALANHWQSWRNQAGDYTRLLVETQADILQTRRSEKDMLIRLDRPKALARARQSWQASSRKVSDGLQALGEQAPAAAQREQFKLAQQDFDAYRSGLVSVIEDLTRGAFASAGAADRAAQPHTEHLRAVEPQLEAALAGALRQSHALALQLDQVADLGPALVLAALPLTLALGALGGGCFSRAAPRAVTQAAATPRPAAAPDLAVHVHEAQLNGRTTPAPGSKGLQQTAPGMEQTTTPPQQRAVPTRSTNTASSTAT